MSVASTVISILALVPALVWLAVGVAGLRGNLPRNRWFGVRSVETMRSDETFAVANRAAGIGFIGAGAILLVTAVIGLAIGRWGFVSVLFGAVVAVLVLVAVGNLAIQAARTVPVPEATGCGCCSDDDAGCGDTASSCSDTDEESAAADCGESSCGTCALSGMCLSETADSRDTTPSHSA